jgi:hypothetical protein
LPAKKFADSEMAELVSLPDEMTGRALQAFLLAAGIDARIRELQASFYSTVLNPKGIWGKLVIPRAQAGEAHRLLEAWRRGFHSQRG